MHENELIVYRTGFNNGHRTDFDYYYRISRLNTDWENPSAHIFNKMRFLKQFRCQGFSYAIEDQLENTLEELIPLFNQITNIEIQDLDNHEETYPVIQQLFETLKAGIRGFRETATSKFLHMTYPNLLVMADSIIASYMQNRNIIHHYFTKGDDYINLLRFYCSEINELIEDIMENHHLSRLDAVNRIREMDEYAVGSIPRIIDKHFYWIETH